ncbi:putative nuclease HARBI1 [Cinnamomum micranthum f. kanehirae]|uniref:Putative nuclease HARBI1 n=1 Tax=Cinnamomum micranthum f. kanehirae TaxID=337451 RepID=A0A443ND23_9MAGN|nr:putative nuclease HARBI1 [Cinnamomum micranthum f. kanehirae]
MFNYITAESDNQIISVVVSVVVACCGLATLWLTLEEEQSRKKRLISSLSGKIWVKELLSSEGPQCHENLRMSPNCFMRLRDTLMQRGLLQHTRIMSVDEQLATLLHILAHNVTNRVMPNRFNHSRATVSQYFHIVLDAKCKVYPHCVQIPENAPTPQQIRTYTRFYPYFKNCIRAIDGTHVPAHVPFSKQAKYRNRHGQLSQNCLMASGFDKKFQYVLARWEGSATDATVLFSTLNRGDILAVPDGKFYLVDASYGNAPGFLKPYRGVRYHLKEFEERPRTNY